MLMMMMLLKLSPFVSKTLRHDKAEKKSRMNGESYLEDWKKWNGVT